MNYKMVFRLVARVVGMEAALLLLPTLVALIYSESIKGFLVAIGVAALFSVVLILSVKPDSKHIFSKEGFACVALSWVAISLIGAIPFVVEGEIPHFIDAFFETVSGFTTTGASIITNVEELSRGLLFWRSFTHWIGGMGILVLMMAVVPMSEQYSMYIMRAEVPGPSAGKLVPKVQNSSLILYLIYIALTLLEILFLIVGKMPLYDAVVHAFGTAGTGGFGIKALSVGAYQSAYIETVIGVFMLLFGINFNLYFLLLLRKVKAALLNEELICYVGIILFSTLTIALNISPIYNGFVNSLRYAFFQVASIITTTGYFTTDFALWPEYSKTLLVFLMFVGACAGSTAGGIKVSRVLILVRTVRSEIKHLLRPHSYNTVTLDGREVSKSTIRCTLVFFFIYILMIAVSTLAISLENYDTVTNLTSVITCVSNVGPGLSLVGPYGSFAMFSGASKLLLSMCMLMGRLELFPILMLFSLNTWRKGSEF